MPSSQTPRQEDRPVLDYGEENFDRQGLVARKEVLRPSNSGRLTMPSHILLLFSKPMVLTNQFLVTM